MQIVFNWYTCIRILQVKLDVQLFLKSDIVSLNIAIVIRYILCTKIKHWDMKMGVKQKIKRWYIKQGYLPSQCLLKMGQK